MIQSESEVFQKAIEQWGCINQMDMAIEEAAELIQAINKIKRIFSPAEIKRDQLIQTFNTPKLPQFETQKKAEVYHNICGEIADMKIMLKQLEMIFNKETIDLCYQRKIARLEDRLNALEN